jgi:hypothetical protein
VGNEATINPTGGSKMYNEWISGGKVESHPNANYVTFHMRHEITGQRGYYSTEYAVDDKHLGPREVPYLTMVTIKAIQSIPGVRKVLVSPYKISVVKADAFTWGELYPAIKLGMSKYLPARYH